MHTIIVFHSSSVGPSPRHPLCTGTHPPSPTRAAAVLSGRCLSLRRAASPRKKLGVADAKKIEDEGRGAARPLGQRRGERPLPLTARRNLLGILVETSPDLNCFSLLGGSQVEGREVSAIGPGLLVLVGVHEADTDSDADFMYILLSLFSLYP